MTWGADAEKAFADVDVDVVVASDVVYWNDSMDDLVMTLRALAKTPKTRVLMAYGRNRQALEKFLDVSRESFRDGSRVAKAIEGASTIFVNAVVGLTSSGFNEGTSALDAAVAANVGARKYFGGGGTLQEFKSLSPGLFLSALDDPKFYLFTGGGTVLKALAMGGAELGQCVHHAVARCVGP